jgi:hypothetical protein
VITEFLAPIETVSSKISVAYGGPTAAAFFFFNFWQLSFVFAFTRPQNQLNFFKHGIMMFCCDCCVF